MRLDKKKMWIKKIMRTKRYLNVQNNSIVLIFTITKDSRVRESN